MHEAVFNSSYKDRPQIAANSIGIDLNLIAPTPGHGWVILGLDFGTSKIGVAVGQHLTATASPIGKVNKPGQMNWVAMDRIIREWQPNLLVVGLPLNMDSSRGDMVEAAERFARRMQGRYKIPFEMFDERLSTFEAKQHQYDDIDAGAACLILESWLSIH